jgi:hypothetical protein
MYSIWYAFAKKIVGIDIDVKIQTTEQRFVFVAAAVLTSHFRVLDSSARHRSGPENNERSPVSIPFP